MLWKPNKAEIEGNTFRCPTTHWGHAIFHVAHTHTHTPPPPTTSTHSSHLTQSRRIITLLEVSFSWTTLPFFFPFFFWSFFSSPGVSENCLQFAFAYRERGAERLDSMITAVFFLFPFSLRGGGGNVRVRLHSWSQMWPVFQPPRGNMLL